MTDLERFKNEVERYLTRKGMNPTQFGKLFAGDPRFVFQLRTGREPRVSTQERVRRAMKEGVAA